MRERLAAAAFALVLACAGPAVLPLHAQESGAAHEEAGHESKEPGMIWRWANFALLAIGLGVLVKKNAGPFFRERTAQIRSEIEEARTRTAAAEKQMAEVSAKLAALSKEVDALRSDARAELAAETGRHREQTAREIAALQANAEMELDGIVKSAQSELRRFGAGLATEIAAKQLAERMSDESQGMILDRFAAGLDASAGKGR